MRKGIIFLLIGTMLLAAGGCSNSKESSAGEDSNDISVMGESTDEGTSSDSSNNDLSEAEENEVEDTSKTYPNYFDPSIERTGYKMGTIENGAKKDLVQVNIPANFNNLTVYEKNLSDLTNDEISQEEALAGTDSPVVNITATVRSQEDNNTTLYFIMKDSKMTLTEFINGFNAGTEFNWNGHKCFLLGYNDGYEGEKYGDLTVFYEIVPDGNYMAIGYTSIAVEEGAVEELDIADSLCSLVDVL